MNTTPDPAADGEAAFTTALASALLTSETPLAGVERGLAALVELTGASRASAYLFARAFPHDIEEHVAVSSDGQRLPVPEVPLALRAAVLRAPDDDGVVFVPPGRDAEAARRYMHRRGSESLKVCRSLIGEDRVAIVGVTSVTEREWTASETRVLRLVARLIGHSLWRASLERELREQRDALALSEARWRATVETVPAAMFRVDRTGRILLASREVERMGERRVEDIEGALLPELIDEPAVRARFEHDLARVFAGERCESRVRIVTPTGERWLESRAVPETDDDGTVTSALVFAVDVTERSRLEESVAHAAVTDPLTGLANRTVLVDAVEHGLALASAGRDPVSLLFIDLDRFKSTNDALGHGVGDELLRIVADRIRSATRDDDVVARLGGDEFGVLLRGTRSIEDVSRVAQSLRDEIGRPAEVHGHVLHPSASIGAVRSSELDRGANDLLRSADHAMYQAKLSGRNRVQVFDESMRAELLVKRSTETALRAAIHGDSIAVHYLPEIDLESGRVVALEALARWHHPTRGLLAASEFVGLAEDTGLIAELGALVLREACVQGASWARIDPELVLRVNVSARQLAMPRLVGDIAEALVRSALDPWRLSIEVSESSLAGDTEHVLDAIRRVQTLGVSITIDDFGIGHSALSYLERVPVAALKIDRRFVSRLAEGGRDAMIVATLANLGTALGLCVVAEGVETAEQLAVLRRVGCARAQGYLFSKPRPAAEVTALLRQQFVTS